MHTDEAKMKEKDTKNSQSIRIPSSYYLNLKELAKNSKRPIVKELMIILDDYFSNIDTVNASTRYKAISKTSGIIKNLPRKNYGQTIDDVLYGD